VGEGCGGTIMAMLSRWLGLLGACWACWCLRVSSGPRLSWWDQAGSVWDRGLGFWRVRRWPSWQPSRSLGFPLSPKLLALYLAAKYVAKNLDRNLPGADASESPLSFCCFLRSEIYLVFASPIPVGASIPFSAQGDRFTLTCRDLAGHIG
jgi:hypothetical protein